MSDQTDNRFYREKTMTDTREALIKNLLGEYATAHVELLQRLEREMKAALSALGDAHVPSVTCYWDAGDRELGYLGVSEIGEKYTHGEIFSVEHVGIIQTTFHVHLPPAEDSDSDDDWEFEGETHEAVETALKAEIERRAVQPAWEG